MYLIGVDPSINNAAVCLMETKCDVPSSIKTFKLGTHNGTLEVKLAELGIKAFKLFNEILWEVMDAIILIELPGYQDSLKGKKSVETDSFSKLCLSAGIITGSIFKLLEFRTTIDVRLVPPITWKGQVPKSITRKRMKEKYSELIQVDLLTDDEVDALGMADYLYETTRPKSISN